MVDTKYSPEAASTMRHTAVSAFFFLRFLVPALLNPKLFGLTANIPQPRAQRSLTLIAKVLQTMANLQRFGAKESYMEPMNAFLEKNESAFLDYMSYIASGLHEDSPEWTSPAYDEYEPVQRKMSLLPFDLTRDAIPLLPFLLDLPKEIAALVNQIARACSLQSGPTRPEDPSFQRFRELCMKTNWLTLSRLHLEDGPVSHTAIATISTSPLALAHAGFRPSSRASSTAMTEEEVYSSTPNSSPGRFPKIKSPSPGRRTRAHTVGASVARATLRHSSSADGWPSLGSPSSPPRDDSTDFSIINPDDGSQEGVVMSRSVETQVQQAEEVPVEALTSRCSSICSSTESQAENSIVISASHQVHRKRRFLFNRI
jgi:hypothetical protein